MSWWKLAQAQTAPTPQGDGRLWSNVVYNKGVWKFYDAQGNPVGKPTNDFERYAGQADTSSDVVNQKLSGIRADIAAFRQQAQGMTPAQQNQASLATFGKYAEGEYLPQPAAGSAPQAQGTSPAPSRAQQYTQSYNQAYDEWEKTDRRTPFKDFKAQFDKGFGASYQPGAQPAQGYQSAQTTAQGGYSPKEDGKGGLQLFAPNQTQPYATIPAAERSTPANQQYIQKMTGKPDAPAAVTPPGAQVATPKPASAPKQDFSTLPPPAK